MPSPFPGMDPYIETAYLWPGFHNDLAAEIYAALNRVLPPRYVANLPSYLAYETVEIGARRSVQPDVFLTRSPIRHEEAPGAVATLAPAPVQSAIPWEVPITLYRVEIRSTEDDLLVTAIEILSPVNKRPGEDASGAYLRKRKDLFRSSAHFIEIDLLRAGERPPMALPVPAAPYYVMLSRADRRPSVEVWPIQLQESLPSIPVPVLEPDPDVPLDLSAVVASVYERGAYERKLDYRQPPPPPLSTEEAAWVEALLRERGRSSD